MFVLFKEHIARLLLTELDCKVGAALFKCIPNFNCMLVCMVCIFHMAFKRYYCGITYIKI